jgi:molecular chaperone GrpE
VTEDSAVNQPEPETDILKIKQHIEELEQKVKELEEENSTLKDQYLRKQADFENFRKRMHREKEDATKFANANLLLDLVSIIDDFERAIKAGEDTQDIESFRKGIELIEKQLVGMLERKWGLRRFDSEGEPFDPEKHEAIATEEKDTDVSEVTEDYQKGYFLHDRVLRHAKVKVSLPSTVQAASTDEKENTDEQDNTDKGEE